MILIQLILTKSVVAIESYPIRIRFLESYTSKDLRIGNKLQFELYEALNSNHKLPRLSKGYIEILCVNKSEFFVQKARVSLGNGRFAGLENINHEVKMFNLDSKEKINITDLTALGTTVAGGTIIGTFGALGAATVGAVLAAPALLIGGAVFVAGKSLKKETVVIEDNKIYDAEIEILD
jgi:hypothetical protein